MDINQLSRVLKKELAGIPQYQETLKILMDNSKTEIWLVGGMVYKTLINKLYKTFLVTHDLDFLTHKQAQLDLPVGWSEQKTKHGEPRLQNGEIRVDIMWLENMHSIIERGLDYKVEHYLSGVPLTIQSIAYDVRGKTLLGEAGIDAILSKTVKVMNQDEYNYCSKTYGDHYSVERYSEMLGFNQESKPPIRPRY